MRTEFDPSLPHSVSPLALWTATQARPKFAAVINNSATGANRRRHKRAAARLAAAAGKTIQVEHVDGANLVQALRSVANSAPDVVVVLGGDGTARTALETLSPLGIATAPLPGGTLNRIARTLYGDATCSDIIEKLRFGTAAWVGGGQVAGRKFFVASGYGGPMLLNSLREHARQRSLTCASRALSRLSKAFDHGFRLGDNSRVYNCAIVGVGPIDTAFGLSRNGDASCLEVAATRWDSWIDPLTLAPSIFFGTWRKNEDIEIVRTTDCEIVSSEGAIPALLDGEAFVVPTRSVVRWQPRCGLAWRIPSLSRPASAVRLMVGANHST